MSGETRIRRWSTPCLKVGERKQLNQPRSWWNRVKRKCKGRATSGQPQIPLNVLLHDVVRPTQTKCKDQKEEKMHSDTVGVHSEVTATLENEGSVAQPVTSKEKLLCRQNLSKKALGGWAARGGTAARRVKGDLQKRKPIALQRRERGVLKWRYPCTLQKSSGRSLWIIHDRAMITLDQPWHRRKMVFVVLCCLWRYWLGFYLNWQLTTTVSLSLIFYQLHLVRKKNCSKPLFTKFTWLGTFVANC